MWEAPAVESEAVLTWVAAALPSVSPMQASVSPMQAQDHKQSANRSYDGDDHRDNEPSYDDDDRGRSGRSHDRDADEDDDDRGTMEFSPRDRRIISECLVENRSDLPPGLAKQDRLPQGLERQLQRNGTLPPGLQGRVQPLPSVCTPRLRRRRPDWVRVLLGGRIILLDPTQR